MLIIKADGANATVSGLSRVATDAERKVMHMLESVAHDIARRARDRVLLQRKASPAASSPLADSIDVKPVAGGFKVSANVSYAPFVELGTSRMAPAPFLGPSFDEAVAGLAQDFGTGGRL